MFQKVVVLLFIFTEGRISHSDQVAGGPGHVNGAWKKNLSIIWL